MQRSVHLCALLAMVSIVALTMGACPSTEDPLEPFLPPLTVVKSASAPSIDPWGGTFAGSVEVRLVAASGSTIYYTLDGSTPSDADGTLYTGPFTLTDSADLEAIAYADGLGPSPISFATFTRSGTARGLGISDIACSGSLVAGQPSYLSIQCKATAADTRSIRVAADLSQVGGSRVASLELRGDTWSWAGSVTALSPGSKTITFTATDGSGGEVSATSTISVGQPDAQPVVSSPLVSGTLTAGRAAVVTVTCYAADPDGLIASVQADLSAIGGSSSQVLSLAGSSRYGWSGSVTPRTAGQQAVTFIATDSRGAQAETTIAVTVASNRLPSISNPAVTGSLQLGESGTVTVSCYASDPDGAVQSVRADLSLIGGSATQALAQAGSFWTWTGTVTPQAAGSREITFTAIDDTAAAASVTTNVTVALPNQPPTIAGQAVTASLIEAVAGSVTVSCTASDSDGTVAAVRANLSSLGGSTTQSLTFTAGTWTWTGTLTPPSRGQRTVTFTATDNTGAIGTASATITVAAPNVAPTVSAPTATGTLMRNAAGSLTVSCMAADSDGTVVSVRADLSALGGSATQALAFATDRWTWTGQVTPPTHGTKTVTFTAADSLGATGTASTTITVATGQPGTLADIWTGNVTWSQYLVLGSPPYNVSSFTQPATTTFSADYQPQTLGIYFAKSNTVYQLPANGLRSVGDQQTTVYPDSPTTTITGTVIAITRTATAFSIDLNLQITCNGTISGTYQWQATLQQDDTISCSETTPLIIGGLNIGLNVSSTGALSRP